MSPEGLIELLDMDIDKANKDLKTTGYEVLSDKDGLNLREYQIKPIKATEQAVTDYDLVIVDEAHRGYILDKEISEDELLYRNQEDYVSKYRTVIEYFDAVKWRKIGLIELKYSY